MTTYTILIKRDGPKAYSSVTLGVYPINFTSFQAIEDFMDMEYPDCYYCSAITGTSIVSTWTAKYGYVEVL